ncbi:Pheromone B alpha 1 receptor [Mycena sanguinolenta]|uniref:Pheromone B alpha 1 receptor n=1 Tax=Mycena sanguinolenta TaxID=230812 RepID=A0A8H6Z5U6_9AGAR|nr:Pheromone B alpha 1 receptor [Mycena sanguinolenta]
MTYFYTGPPNWVFSAFAFIGFLCSTIPLPWHLEAWNVGTVLYMIWTALACLVFFINSIIWNGNVLDSAPTWCDLSTHFINGFNLAIPACSLCINRRLYQIASVQTVLKTKAEKRRAILVDLAISLGLPVLQIPLRAFPFFQFLIHRARPPLQHLRGRRLSRRDLRNPRRRRPLPPPPILVGCVSAVYCILSIRALARQRTQFKALLASSANANLTLNRYLRLMLLAATDLLCTIPLGIWVLWVNVKVVGLSPWISWADTHSHFSNVEQVPGVYWRAKVYDVASLETTRWLTVACALLFFAYFGFADEAFKNYRSAFASVARKMGYSIASDATLASSGPQTSHPSTARASVPPVFIRKTTVSKRDSLFDSTGTFTSMADSYDEKDSASSSPVDVLPTLGYDKADSSSSSSGDSIKEPESPIEGEDIDVSSLHRNSLAVPAPAPPAAAHTRPTSVVLLPLPTFVRDAADIV